MLLSKIPGLSEAVKSAQREEEVIREFAFSGLPESICGLDVEPFRIPHLRQLILIDSPFVTGKQPSVRDAFEFLWIVSLIYPKDSAEAKKAFWNRLKRVKTDWVSGIRDYIAEAMMDAPSGGGGDAPITSMSASLVHLIASTYGWSREQIEREPIKSLYQYVRLIRRDNNPQSPIGNPLSDSVAMSIAKQFHESNK